MIDLSIHPKNVRERRPNAPKNEIIIIPTFKQQRQPEQIPPAITERLKTVGLWDINPLNLFRITWHNEPTPHGGGYGPVTYLEFPQTLTGVEARIVAPGRQVVSNRRA